MRDGCVCHHASLWHAGACLLRRRILLQVVPVSPFKYADVITTTTHKSLRGPRGAMIFFRRGQKGADKKGNPIMYDFEDKINQAVFPGLQGGPHNHTITALAIALKAASSPEFNAYQTQVLKNSAAMAKALTAKGYQLVSGSSGSVLLVGRGADRAEHFEQKKVSMAARTRLAITMSMC